MTRTLTAAALALLPLLSWAQEGGKAQYISDDISVTLRDAPRNDAAVVGAVTSGAKVTVIESLGDQSFSRVRTVDGRTGWMTARYLSSLPAAKDRLKDLQTELSQSREQAKQLQSDLDSARNRLEAAKPALEAQADAERLKSELASAVAQNEADAARLDQERARRRTLVTGAALVGAGILLGLILPWLGRSGGGRRRRRNEL